MPETVKQFLDRNNCEYQLSDYVLKKTIIKSRSNMIDFTMPCGHDKRCSISILLKPVHCEACHLWNTYGYDVEDSTLTCGECERVMYEVPRTNLHAWKCWHCRENPSAEFRFLRLMDGYLDECDHVYVTRNAQYPKTDPRQKAKTADAKIVKDGVEYHIEIDEVGHLSRKGKAKHYQKDRIAAEKGLRLIRFHASDVSKRICRFIMDRIDNWDGDEGGIKILGITPKSYSFYRKLYPEDDEVLAEEQEVFEVPEEEEALPEEVVQMYMDRLARLFPREPAESPEDEMRMQASARSLAEELTRRAVQRLAQAAAQVAVEEPQEEAQEEPQEEHQEEPQEEPQEEEEEKPKQELPECRLCDLRDEFTQRVVELCAYYTDIEEREGEQAEDMRAQLTTILEIAANLAVLIDSEEADEEELLAALKRWLQAATSTLIFNGRDMALQPNQAIKEQE